MLLLDFYGEETCLMPTVVCVQSAAVAAQSQKREIERIHFLLVRMYAIETDMVWLYRRLATIILNSNSNSK